MKWFKHYSKAHQDRAIEKLIMEFGYAGYGLYFYCLEIIAGTVELDNITFELEPDVEILAHRGRMDTVLVGKIMHRCIELGLFEIADSGRITCLKLAKYIEKSATSNAGMRVLIDSLKGKNHDSVMTQSGQNHDSVMTESEIVMTESPVSQGVPDQIRLDIDKNKRREEFTQNEPKAPVSQSSTALVVSPSALPKKVKKDELPPAMMPTLQGAKAAFEASAKAKAMMYADPQTAAREIKALKLLVRRAHKLSPEAPDAFLAKVMESYRVLVNGKLKGKASWVPTGLATLWVWNLVLEGLQSPAATAEDDRLSSLVEGMFSKKARA